MAAKLMVARLMVARLMVVRLMVVRFMAAMGMVAACVGGTLVGCGGAPRPEPMSGAAPASVDAPTAAGQTSPTTGGQAPVATGEAGAARRIGPALVARPLPGVPAWVITHERPIPANALLYLADDGTPILADTPWTPSATQALLGWVRARFGRLPALATISHFHLDAAGGIQALREAGVPVVASTETARLSRERGPGMQAELREEHGDMFAGFTVPAPSETFAPAEGFVATVGGTRVEVIFPGGAHAHDNVVTWFPERRVLFGGCMVKGGDSLGYLGDANLETYASAIERIRALQPTVVVPGHGDRTDPAQLEHTLKLLAATRSAQSP